MKKCFKMLAVMLLFGWATTLAQTVDVTFQVDMSIKIATEKFDPATDEVQLRGSFDGWGAGAVMTDVDNDSVYTVTVTGQPQNTVIFHKYVYVVGATVNWESDPNREINSGTSATLTVDPYFFDDKTPNTGITSSITFEVDMRLPAQGNFNPDTDTVFVAGNFTDWQNGAIEMTDVDNDTIFTVDVNTVTSGDLAIYKFIWSNGARTWESGTVGDDIIPGTDGNRIYGIHDGTNTVSRWWVNTDPTVVQLADGNIFFEVDMSVLTELGVFNPSVDSIQIRGGFNGWADTDPARSHMTQNAVDPNNWYIDIPFVQVELNSTQFYKYFLKNGTGSTTPYANTGWEVSIDPTTSGNRDRPIVFLGSPTQESGLQYFDGVKPEWVIPSGTTVECEFSVDMTYATLADTQGTDPVFNPATDTVYWIPRHPLYYAVNELPWPGDYPKIYAMTDPDQDMIYKGTLTIAGPNFNGFLYNYAYTAGTSLIQEDGSQEEVRVRYIAQTAPRTFVSPYSAPLDIWSNTEKPEEVGPLSSIDELPGTPIEYSLDQNYPNPFNPATLIRFSIPEQGLVSIKVFNLLGEEVATLVNGELSSGNYEVNFNGAKLSSGIYFYTITTNNFIATKKMMMIK